MSRLIIENNKREALISFIAFHLFFEARCMKKKYGPNVNPEKFRKLNRQLSDFSDHLFDSLMHPKDGPEAISEYLGDKSAKIPVDDIRHSTRRM